MSESTAPYPRPRIVAWAMFLFFLTSIASVMDRKIISLLVDPLRADLGVSDVEIGILQGAAFAICYTHAPSRSASGRTATAAAR